MTHKYFGRIRQAQAADGRRAQHSLPPFDLGDLYPHNFLKRTAGRLLMRAFPLIFALLRRFWPIARFAGIVWVTRAADVRAVLDDGETFQVPFGPEMLEAAGGSAFVLGLDGADHQRQRAIIAKIVRPEDSRRIADLSQRVASALIENAQGRIDAVRDLITRSAAEVCFRYFGLGDVSADEFAEWSIAVSIWLFADPSGDPNTRAVALNAAARMRKVLRRSIERARDDAGTHDDTLVARLVALQRSGENALGDGEIVAILMGMATGFIPTNTLAAGKILQALVERPGWFRAAQDAAVANDRARLLEILLEAARLNPSLMPGQWRWCPAGATIVSPGGRSTAIAPGSLLMVAVSSALRDPAEYVHPHRFIAPHPDPRGGMREPDLVFGAWDHACMGKHIALGQVTEVFLALLGQPGLALARGSTGRMQLVDPYPVRLDFTFDAASASQSMLLVLAPVTSGMNKAGIDGLLGAMGDPARCGAESMAECLDSTGIVHFASLSSIADHDGANPTIIFELNVDGAVLPALQAIAARAKAPLEQLFAEAGFRPGADLAEFLHERVVKLTLKPWGATGLNFFGTPGMSVSQIDVQTKLAGFVRTVVLDRLRTHAHEGDRALATLNHVRRVIMQQAGSSGATTADGDRLTEVAAQHEYDKALLVPSRHRLLLADWQPVTYWGAFKAFLRSDRVWIAAVPFAATYAFWLAWILSRYPLHALRLSCVWTHLLAYRWCGTAMTSAAHGLAIVLAMLGALGAALVTWAFVGAAAALYLRHFKEARDPVDRRQASLARMAAIGASENNPGTVQNHIMAVGTMKPGLFRKLVHAFALWAIAIAIRFYYRPGFVVTMGTIHFARWWRVPGTDRGVFFSNYDGSWESYLEDFITRARWGQSAAWSNWQGYPETRFLILKGAQDGDAFKRWVRLQQQPVPLWYSRYPALTTDHIRTNALIHHGLARVRNDAEARDWLRCFGSMPRAQNLIETAEVQTLVFSGLSRLPHTACHAIAVPRDNDAFKAWQNLLIGRSLPVSARAELADPHRFGIMKRVENDTVELIPSATIAFGELNQVMAAEPGACFIAYSAAGLARIERMACGEGNCHALLENFSVPFRLGMAGRAKILGDFDGEAPEHWSWSDRAAGDVDDQSDTVDAVLLIYAPDPGELSVLSSGHMRLLAALGGAEIERVVTQPTACGLDYEHFGYRDGISQPVIRGTERGGGTFPERDLVAPGEFLFGYQNNQGFFPPSAMLPAELDENSLLPLPTEGELSLFPDFGATYSENRPRDFGRNGTFLVVRQFEQHVDRFETFLSEMGTELIRSYPRVNRTIGQMPGQEWVAAKLMGRWRDGTPLVGNSLHDLERCPVDRPDNDFSYGADDPEGLACPLGAHIRRANPRDSLKPGDRDEQTITNRHRLLRRGRTYEVQHADDEKLERGLLFMCLCADLERQFEFVQQTWINSPDFHGLEAEPDAFVGSRHAGQPRGFTVPTPAGPVSMASPTLALDKFSTVKSGGYFFLPSRAALKFLGTWGRVDYGIMQPAEAYAAPKV